MILAIFAIVSVSFTSCELEDEEGNSIWGDIFSDVLSGVVDDESEISSLFGFQPDNENLDQLESDIYLGSGSNNPSSVDLSDKFPPIGNQGAYGTCVAWSIGYNLKTSIEAIDQGYSKSQLSDPGKQFSPKYLFWTIADADKGDDCNGTWFEPALDVLVSKGIPTMSAVPYESLGNCSHSTNGTWDNSASAYKIEKYRKIDHNSTDILKSYLAQGRPISIGARLGDRFMGWNSSAVLSSDTYNNPGMMHAYHAMALCGYDDSKNAFRVVNSWDSDWGDNGYIWVDYDFFTNKSGEFAFCAFVATNVKGNPDEDGDGNVDPEDLAQGYDLVSWNLLDEDYNNSEDPSNTRDRFITYNVYNSGNNAISASQDWNILYAYYNAYDANDYGILIFDYYTDDYGDNERHYDPIPSGDANAVGQTNWWNNINVPAGKSVAGVLIEDDNFTFDYEVPSTLNGDYYFVLIADGYDVIKEDDEDNNYYFFTADNDEPIKITNGVIDNSNISKKKLLKSAPGKNASSPMPTVRTKSNPNTYSPDEIMTLIKHQKQTGELQLKAAQFMAKKQRATDKNN